MVQLIEYSDAVNRVVGAIFQCVTGSGRSRRDSRIHPNLQRRMARLCWLLFLTAAAFAAAERGSETLNVDFQSYSQITYFGFDVRH